MSHDVFISYSSKEEASAYTVLKGLEDSGVSCWIAPRDIPDGSDYPEEVIKGIIGAKILVLLLSDHSNASRWVASEVERAANYNLGFVVFRIEDVAPARRLELMVSRSQRLDAFTPPLEKHIARLASAVQMLLKQDIPPVPGEDVLVEVTLSAADARSGGKVRLPVNGKVYDLPFRPEIVEGTEERYPGLGQSGSHGGAAGTLIVCFHITTDNHPSPLPIVGNDIRHPIDISSDKARNGGKASITLKGRQFELPFPAGCTEGSEQRYAGLGEPGRHGGSAGALILTFHITTTKLEKKPETSPPPSKTEESSDKPKLPPMFLIMLIAGGLFMIIVLCLAAR